LNKVARIVGSKNVSAAPEVLARYAQDSSLVTPRQPNYVVWPADTAQIQQIVKLANKESLPLVPRSSGVGFTGSTIPSQGGMVVDLSRMKRIIEVDPRNRMARVEPGVTFGQLQAALAPQALMCLNPLLPHATKSVLSAHLEREPMLIPKFEYGDPLLTMELVLPTGDIFRTGSASAPGAPDDTLADLVGPFGPGLDFYRLFQGAQGTLGIATWAAVKVEHLPRVQKVFFFAFDTLEELVEPVYRLQRKMLGNECFILDNNYLAVILAEDDGEIDELKDCLPPWTLVMCLAGGLRRPEEKIAYEEEALREVAADFILSPSEVLPGAPGLEKRLIAKLRQPWPEDVTYWRFRDKGGTSTVGFHALLETVPDLVQGAIDFVAGTGYPVEDMGCYCQPLERARAAYCELGLSYDPEDPEEMALVADLYADLSEYLYEQGALFTRPYGAQARMVYERAATYAATLKDLKKIFDPNHIMNPGKLCF
ncbi:MAG: FAD-binding oxidoreductase, partial [Chloroflexota bacterium]